MSDLPGIAPLAPPLESKKPWQSKTMILNALIPILLIIYPPAAAYLSANPLFVAGGWSILNIILRAVSKDKISLSD